MPGIVGAARCAHTFRCIPLPPCGPRRMSGGLWPPSPFDKLRVSGKTCPAASHLRPLQRGEGEEQLLDAGLALEGDDDLIAGAGGLAGDDDPLPETGVTHVVAGREDFGGG